MELDLYGSQSLDEDSICHTHFARHTHVCAHVMGGIESVMFLFKRPPPHHHHHHHRPHSGGTSAHTQNHGAMDDGIGRVTVPIPQNGHSCRGSQVESSGTMGRSVRSRQYHTPW